MKSIILELESLAQTVRDLASATAATASKSNRGTNAKIVDGIPKVYITTLADGRQVWSTLPDYMMYHSKNAKLMP